MRTVLALSSLLLTFGMSACESGGRTMGGSAPSAEARIYPQATEALVQAILGTPLNAKWKAPHVFSAGHGAHRDGEFVWQDFPYDDRRRGDNAGDLIEIRFRVEGWDLIGRAVLNTLRPEDETQLLVTVDGQPFAVTRTEAAYDATDNTIEFRLPGVAARDSIMVNLIAMVGEEVTDLGFNTAEADAFQPDARVYFHDRHQSRVIDSGDFAEFDTRIDLQGLRNGRADALRPQAGLHIRVYRSLQPVEGNASYASGTPLYNSSYQPYTLYVPSQYDPETPAPLNMVLHSLNNVHTEFTVVNVFEDTAEPFGALGMTPLALGQEGWYTDAALVDTLTAWEHVRATMAVDDSRTTVAGYSMGGYGTYRLATLLPDRIAAGWMFAGVPSYGTAAGDTGPQLENTLHVPLMMVHGMADPLVPYATTALHWDRLRELGHPHRVLSHPQYHHWSHRETNDFTREGHFVSGFQAPAGPARVVFHVRPESWATPGDSARHIQGLLEQLSFELDSAYWVRDVLVHDGQDVKGIVDLTSEAVAARVPVTNQIAEAGVLIPGEGLSYGALPQPYQTTGLDRTWNTAPVANRLSGSLQGVRALSIDLDRAGLQLEELDIDIQADGPVELTLLQGGRAHRRML